MTLWFAPRVGIVKQVERERVEPPAQGSGERTSELVAFEVR